MNEDLIKITPDIQKAKSILKMVDNTLEMISQIDTKFSSNIIKEYYEVIRELITILLTLNGYKIYGESAHKKLIEYLKENYSNFTAQEIFFIDELRILRNKISYDGFFIEKDYIIEKKEEIINIIKKLKLVISKRI